MLLCEGDVCGPFCGNINCEVFLLLCNKNNPKINVYSDLIVRPSFTLEFLESKSCNVVTFMEIKHRKACIITRRRKEHRITLTSTDA